MSSSRNPRTRPGFRLLFVTFVTLLGSLGSATAAAASTVAFVAAEDPPATDTTDTTSDETLTNFFGVSPDFKFLGIIPGTWVSLALGGLALWGAWIAFGGIKDYVKVAKKGRVESNPPLLIGIGVGMILFAFAFKIVPKVFEILG